MKINNVRAKGVASVKAEVINDLTNRGYMATGNKRDMFSMFRACGIVGNIYEGESFTKSFPGKICRGYRYTLRVIITEYYKNSGCDDYIYMVKVIKY